MLRPQGFLGRRGPGHGWWVPLVREAARDDAYHDNPHDELDVVGKCFDIYHLHLEPELAGEPRRNSRAVMNGIKIGRIHLTTQVASHPGIQYDTTKGDADAPTKHASLGNDALSHGKVGLAGLH